MKKMIRMGLVIFAIVGAVGCGKGKTGKSTEQEQGKTVKEFVSEDYNQGNRTKNLQTMLKTDKGFYHYIYEQKGIRYYDLATGKDMFLCNKPECRHDGNEFCVATNDKYITLELGMYNDTILKYALEETDTKYLFKVLAVALDGSSMDEIATVLEMEKPTEGFSIYQSRMYLHRNKALLTMCGSGQGELDDTEHNGAAILDLNTREVTYLGEEPFGKNNAGIYSVKGFGDYFFYCQKDGKKTMLHRYHIGTGKDESYMPLIGFVGDYVILNEDMAVYIKSSGTAICTLCFSTGETVEKTSLFRRYYEWDGKGDYILSENKKMCTLTGLETDGTYLYAPEGQVAYVARGENGEETVIRRDAYIHVLNQDLEELVLVDMAAAEERVEFDDIEWEGVCYTQTLRYMGDEIYWQRVRKGMTDSKNYVFRCKRSDFLEGEPKFEFVYQFEGY